MRVAMRTTTRLEGARTRTDPHENDGFSMKISFQTIKQVIERVIESVRQREEAVEHSEAVRGGNEDTRKFALRWRQAGEMHAGRSAPQPQRSSRRRDADKAAESKEGTVRLKKRRATGLIKRVVSIIRYLSALSWRICECTK